VEALVAEAAGGPGFPTTHWATLVGTEDRDSEARRAAWQRLATRYWRPLHLHVRARTGAGAEEARDLVQDFFAWMMEQGLPGRADPARGRFRVFVRFALDNFLRSEARARMRAKRGGGEVVFSLEALESQGWEIDAAAVAPDGGDVLERAWRRQLLSRALEMLEQALAEQGKERYGRLFRDYYLAVGESPTHAELAARHGVRETDVNNYLRDAKRRFREILTALVAETVDGPDELQAELAALFGEGGP
jgi:RNA polymerase sigma-70 factor (ECF subfamily)